MKELLMGNEAIAVGAIAAGVQVVTGYPGTPSTEVLETVAKRNPGHIHVEWSTNEKAAMEVAAGASYSGARTLVTMKQVGLNVASDPLMSLNYIGVKGGMVILVADDPGPISSQTEQDTRRFAKFSKMALFDPSSPEEAYEMVKEAYEYSEKYHMPVFLRTTTRISHSCATVEVGEFPTPEKPEGFVKDSKWVIFPRLSYQAKLNLEEREEVLGKDFSSYSRNEITGSGSIGVACGGVSYAYVREAIMENEDKFTLFKVATPYPFPADEARRFIENTEHIIVFEELDSVIEDELLQLAGAKRDNILGKRTGHVIRAGELSAEKVQQSLKAAFGTEETISEAYGADAPQLPMRPPVLCAGCPHRASFYAVKKAMAGKKAVFCGDIGCYTLGNAAPLDMVDTCLCMGAGITIAQGIGHAENGSVNFAFVGDSTFFASGITGVINAVYNKSDMVLVVLDNSTTAMTGHQPHPGIGVTVMGEVSSKVSIPDVLKAIGLTAVIEADPLNHEEAVAAVKKAVSYSGVKAIIFKSPCIALMKPSSKVRIDGEKCIGCKKCVRELGCPAISLKDRKAVIDSGLCTGCGLCSQICPRVCMIREEA